MAFGDWDMFGEVAPRQPGPRWQESAAAHAECAWCPPVDVYERDDALVLVVDLPGVLKEDIDLRMEVDVLTLAGQRRREDRPGVRLERPMGRFHRSFRIRLPVTAEGATATFREGVLEIVLYKAAQPGPGQVRVTVE